MPKYKLQFCPNSVQPLFTILLLWLFKSDLLMLLPQLFNSLICQQDKVQTLSYYYIRVVITQLLITSPDFFYCTLLPTISPHKVPVEQITWCFLNMPFPFASQYFMLLESLSTLGLEKIYSSFMTPFNIQFIQTGKAYACFFPTLVSLLPSEMITSSSVFPF